MKKLLLILCCVFIAPALAQHAQYQFSTINVQHGLSNDQVMCIFKDSRGFMWFGTNAGLNRYDGYKIKAYRHETNDTSSLNDDLVSSIIELPDRKLLIKNQLGYNIYDFNTDRFTHNLSAYIQDKSIPVDQITNIHTFGKTSLLLVHPTKGIYCYNYFSKQSRLYKAGSGVDDIAGFPISHIAIDDQQNLWIIHINGTLEKYDTRLNKVVYRAKVIPDFSNGSALYNIYVDHQNDVWLFSSSLANGIYYLNTNSSKLQHFYDKSATNKLNSNIVNRITQDDEGLIWIATDHGGINLLDKKDFSIKYITNREGDSKSLAQNSIISIYKDNSGIIWAGTFKKGISYYHKNIIKFPLIRHLSSDSKSLPFNDVNRFVEDAKGNLWIGTNGGGLIYYNRKSGSYTQYKHQPLNSNSISNDVIVSLCIDHDNKLWIGSFFGGLDCFDGKQFTHYKHNETDSTTISDNRVWEIMEDSRHQLWVGTLAGGLNRFDRDKNIFYHYKKGPGNSLNANYISTIIEDKAGNIWLGTSVGIDVIFKRSGLIKHHIHNENDPSSLIHSGINNLFLDSRGLFWASTREGLSIMDPKTGKCKNFRKEQGLPENNVLDVLEDNNGNVWISTTNGLTNALVSSKNGQLTLKFKNYDEVDGLQGLEFNESASCKTKKGELIFGGANGFNIFYPSGITHTYNKPDVVLTDFQVFNKSVIPGQLVNKRVILNQSITEASEIILKHYENAFSIEFGALDYFNPDKTLIQYQMEGFDKAWITADNVTRKATYTNLDPGVYNFKIKALNNGHTGKLKVLKITVLAPFWKTPLAYIIYVLVFVSGLLLIRRRGIKQLRAQFALQQEREQAHRLHELDMMKIKFFTNVSHEFRTPLSLILAPVDKILKQVENSDQRQQLQLINRNARRLLNLVNQLLDFRKMEVQELKLFAEDGDIVKFIEEIALSFNDIAEKKSINFVYDSETESLLASFDHDKVERILFNLLSNAFKFTPAHGHVSVLINQQTDNKDILEIKVIDTGIGIAKDKLDKIFERFFQNDVPGFMLNQGSGIGLAITKEFVKLHNGEITVESEVGEGSCFTVRLPVCTLCPEQLVNKVYSPAEDEATLKPLVNAANKVSGKKQTVLLVEDNDDFRFYLKDNLKVFFNIIEACNGKEGWQKALALHPNLIVSDISMPEMNGIDLCKKLKNDSRTTHIPVLLLTALIGEEQQLRGLETGASDYMTKPFNFEILLSKVKNILLQQDLMRKTYKRQVEVNPAEVVVESPDEHFIQKALQIIEQNISNADFSVEELSSKMFMSRVTLYKKMLVLTGKSPVELIRTVRLKRAVQLLENGYLTISQVSYEVGFKSQKYFSKSFKEEYNMLPSAYLASKKDELVK